MRKDFKEAVQKVRELWLKKPEVAGKVTKTCQITGLSRSRVYRAVEFLELAPTGQKTYGETLSEPEEITLPNHPHAVFRVVDRKPPMHQHIHPQAMDEPPTSPTAVGEILNTLPLSSVYHAVSEHMLEYARVIERFDPVKAKTLREQAAELKGFIS